MPSQGLCNGIRLTITHRQTHCRGPCNRWIELWYCSHTAHTSHSVCYKYAFQIQKKTVSHMKMAVFWVVAPCSLVEVYRFHHDGGSKDLWNVGKLLPDYTALQPRRHFIFVLQILKFMYIYMWNKFLYLCRKFWSSCILYEMRHVLVLWHVLHPLV
jgi:hypothetical protein